MSGKSRVKQRGKSTSRGQSSRTSKKVLHGTARKSKSRNLKCRHCGGWFTSLGEINRHYTAAGHKRRSPSPKGFKIDYTKYSKERIEQAITLLDILQDPIKFRQKLKEHLAKRRILRREYPY